MPVSLLYNLTNLAVENVLLESDLNVCSKWEVREA